MPVRSKWQSLPTEAINPATLAIDKLSAADIVEGMLNEDRKMLAAVQREKERIAVGIDIITQALRKGGRIIFVGAGTSGRLGVARVGGDAADLRHRAPTSCRRSWPAARTRSCTPRKASRTTTRKARGRSTACSPTQEGRRHRRVGERHDAVRARRADARAPRRLEDHLRHLRSAHRAADVRRPDDRAGRRPRSDCRLDAPQGRHRHQDRAQHADDRRDGPHRQDLRQPDGRRADGLGEADAIAPAASSRSSPASSTTRPTSCCAARTGTSRRRS